MYSNRRKIFFCIFETIVKLKEVKNSKMRDFFKKMQLYDSFSINLQISKAEFINKLNSVIEKEKFEPQNIWDKSHLRKSNFIGFVNDNGFKIKRRVFPADSSFTNAKSYGTFSNINDKLVISTEIKGYNNLFIAFYVFMIIFYFAFFTAVISKGDFSALFMLIPHSAAMLLGPYFFMRYNVKKLTYELEREFKYLFK